MLFLAIVVIVILLALSVILDNNKKKELEKKADLEKIEKEKVKTESGFYFAQKFLDFISHAKYYSQCISEKKNLEFIPSNITSALLNTTKENDKTFQLLKIITKSYIYEIRSIRELHRDYAPRRTNYYDDETENIRCIIGETVVLEFEISQNPNEEFITFSWSPPKMKTFLPSGWERDVEKTLEEINNIKPQIQARALEVRKEEKEERKNQEENIFNSLKQKS